MQQLFNSQYFENQDQSRYAWDLRYPKDLDRVHEETVKKYGWNERAKYEILVLKSDRLQEHRLSIFRFQIFSLLFGKSDKSDEKEKIIEKWQCYFKLHEKNADGLEHERLVHFIGTLLKMCSVDMLRAFHNMQYVSSELLTEEDFKRMEEQAQKCAEEVAAQIHRVKGNVLISDFISAENNVRLDIDWIW